MFHSSASSIKGYTIWVGNTKRYSKDNADFTGNTTDKQVSIDLNDDTPAGLVIVVDLEFDNAQSYARFYSAGLAYDDTEG